MADDKDELNGYFTVKQEKVTNLVKTTTQMYYVVAEMIRDSAVTSEPTKWQGTLNDALVTYYASLSSLKIFLNDLLVSPPKDVLKLAKKYNVDGILIRGEDLLILNARLLESEQAAKALEVEHRTLINIH